MTIKVLKTGTYERRALDLFKLFKPALTGKFEIVSFREVRNHRQDPIFMWVLPHKIDVSIDRSRSADPEINVRRSDPVRDGPDAKQWRLERFARDYRTGEFDFEEVFAFIREMTQENAKEKADHDRNAAAMNGDLFGKAVPEGVTLQRNLGKGLYRLSFNVDLRGLDATSMARALAAAEAFNAVVRGLPRHSEDEEEGS